ncbi:histidine phosphatase family protein [Neobacillus mesonae]|uniref:histidine phosphatase family protein n=1 Tax=Neobacillus mesonae TaxID=1193713 RepID=UPI00203C64F0|nr:phosphoglycerate mutase family protein [Neobacillus mesonae]MCM3568030.1 histidine phosphatase family protein [Neobacillus mesonae]
MQITLIRHLPTEWNKKQKLQGRRDILISDVSSSSRSQIEENLHVLKALSPFDVILASTLKRTQQTAHQYQFEPKIESLLDELDFGPFEGHSKELLFKMYGDTWLENPSSLVLGESIQHLEDRIISFIQKYQGCSNVLVFGHGSWIRGLISISRYGHINNMNKVSVANNECVTLTVKNALEC